MYENEMMPIAFFSKSVSTWLVMIGANWNNHSTNNVTLLLLGVLSW